MVGCRASTLDRVRQPVGRPKKEKERKTRRRQKERKERLERKKNANLSLRPRRCQLYIIENSGA